MKKTYYSNQCEESISENDKFTENIMTHTGDDPYQCDLYEKAFPRKNYLIQHKVKHTGEKTYHCNHCEESFSQTIILKEHNEIHTREKSSQLSFKILFNFYILYYFI